MYRATIGTRRYVFGDLKTMLAKASPLRSGDQLAGIAAETGEESVAAQYALADLPLATFLRENIVPYETDEVTRLIVDTHDEAAFAPVAHLTVGGFHDWLLSDETTTPRVSNSCHAVRVDWMRELSCERHTSTKVRVHMPSAKDYRHYAQQCLRYADETENDEDREIFLEMATVWTQLELTSAPADIAKRKESHETSVQ
jgi:Ethanolamine ammonia lyase large subunit (EutB)